MNRQLVANVHVSIPEETTGRLLPVIAAQLDKGGCTCVVVHVLMMPCSVGAVDASCGHDDGCPMEHVGSVDDPVVVLPPGGAN